MEEKLYLQAERHQEQRLKWHQEAMSTYRMEADSHSKSVRNIAKYLLARVVIELGILVVLIILAI